jgi:hypothetical protein
MNRMAIFEKSDLTIHSRIEVSIHFVMNHILLIHFKTLNPKWKLARETKGLSYLTCQRILRIVLHFANLSIRIGSMRSELSRLFSCDETKNSCVWSSQVRSFGNTEGIRSANKGACGCSNDSPDSFVLFNAGIVADKMAEKVICHSESKWLSSWL